MAMGRRKKHRQQKLWVETQALAEAPGHPFSERLAKLLEKHDFDSFVEERCRAFCAEKMGRPSLPPAVCFRLLLIGSFEGIDSERGIAWRLADSISLRGFLGYELSDETPSHSTISRTRRLIDVETHDAVLTWVLRACSADPTWASMCTLPCVDDSRKLYFCHRLTSLRLQSHPTFGKN